MMPTDKERLDWLNKNLTSVFYNSAYQAWGHGHSIFTPQYSTARKAIDAAMKAERRRK